MLRALKLMQQWFWLQVNDLKKIHLQVKFEAKDCDINGFELCCDAFLIISSNSNTNFIVSQTNDTMRWRQRPWSNHGVIKTQKNWIKNT